jgi:hypothetical protein
MNVKKTALATAISFALAGGPVFAKTTTVGGEFILDRNETEAGGVVNLAILGLDKNGVVDLYGEQQGAVIIAVVSSDKGEVIGGDPTPGEQASEPVAGGNFAGKVRYVKLTQGTGRVHITYPYNTADTLKDVTDTVEVILQERVANPSGGVEFNEIARTTKTIEVKQTGSKDPVSLDVVGFEKARVDLQGETDCLVWETQDNPNDPPGCEFYSNLGGISGAMTAGIAGGQVLVRAGNPLAAGNVTVTLRKIDNPKVKDANNKDTRTPLTGAECKPDEGCHEYVYQADMRQGRAVANLDNSVTKAGMYYVEATFDGFEGDSVDLFYADTLEVLSTGTPKGLKLSSSKQTITKPGDDYNYASGGEIGQGTKVWGVLLDEYGNATSNGAGSGDIKISLTDANGVFSNTALNLTVPANSYTGKTEASGSTNTTDSVIGNAKDEILKVGSSSLVAVAVDKQNEPIASIAPSDPLEVKVVTDGLKVESNLTMPQLAGTEFDAFTVYVTDNEGRIKMDANGKPLDPGPVKLTSASGESITVNRKNEAPYHVQGLFRTVTASGDYMVADAAGNYGEVMVSVMGAGIKPAAATVVELQNAHEVKQSVVNPGGMTDEKRYITTLPESAFRMFDDYGNPVTGKQPLKEDDTGTFTAASANGTVGYNTPEKEYGIPGRVYFEPLDAMGNPTSDSKAKSHAVTITYDTTGSDAYAGEDKIQVNFTKPGLGAKSLTVSTNVQAPQELGDIKASIEQDVLPVNSEVAMSVEVLDQNDRLFAGKNALVTLQINGQTGDDITPTVKEITQNRVESSPEVCKTAGGYFDETTQRVDEASGQVKGTCIETKEEAKSAGKSMNFSDTGGRKVFAIAVGAQEGQFSLTFADASNPQDGAKITKTFTVQRKVAPAKTEEECKTEGNYWNTTAESCKELPPATDEKGSSVVKPDGSFGDSNAKMHGGAALAGGDFQQDLPTPITGGASDEIELVGTINFDEDDVGKQVEVVVVIGLEIITRNAFDTNTVFWFQMYTDDSGNAAFDLANAAGDLLSVDLAYLKPFKTMDVSDADKVTDVPIVKGSLAGVDTSADPWRIKIYMGYRLPDGSLVYNQIPFGFYTDY